MVACSVPNFAYSELHACAGKIPEQPLPCKPNAGKPVAALTAHILPNKPSCLLIIKTREPEEPYTIFLPPADGGVGGCTDNPMGCTFTRGLPTEWMTGATAMSAGVTLTPSGLHMHTPGFRFQVHYHGITVLQQGQPPCSTRSHATYRWHNNALLPPRHTPPCTPRGAHARGWSSKNAGMHTATPINGIFNPVKEPKTLRT